MWKCSHWSETGIGTKAHCFLLCQSRSLHRYHLMHSFLQRALSFVSSTVLFIHLQRSLCIVSSDPITSDHLTMLSEIICEELASSKLHALATSRCPEMSVTILTQPNIVSCNINSYCKDSSTLRRYKRECETFLSLPYVNNKSSFNAFGSGVTFTLAFDQCN